MLKNWSIRITWEYENKGVRHGFRGIIDTATKTSKWLTRREQQTSKRNSEDSKSAFDEYKKFSSKVYIPIRQLGSASLDMAYVAAGRCDGFWQRNLNYWDIAAGIVLIKESGGFVTDFNGEDKYLENKTILATNSKINKEMIDILNG